MKKGDKVWIKIKPYRDPPVSGVVKDILTSKPVHTRGIKVRLEDGRIGRLYDKGGERRKPSTPKKDVGFCCVM